MIATTETWRKISVYVCIPAIVAASANAYNLWAKHQEHLEHEKHEGHEQVKYPYMRIRAKVRREQNPSQYYLVPSLDISSSCEHTQF